jgi:hypothetical protein
MDPEQTVYFGIRGTRIGEASSPQPQVFGVARGGINMTARDMLVTHCWKVSASRGKRTSAGRRRDCLVC